MLSELSFYYSASIVPLEAVGSGWQGIRGGLGWEPGRESFGECRRSIEAGFTVVK